MNPWMIAALIAGAIGVASLAKSAALAALPRVTSWALVYIPTPGVNGLWDLWITSLSGASGPAMLSAIPGGQMIYIPAALASKQPMNADWSYTFTPRGSSQPFTIVVPAAVLQAYAAAPKSQVLARAVQSHVYGAQPQGAMQAGTSYVQLMQQLVSQGVDPNVAGQQALDIMSGRQPPPGPSSALADAQQLVKDVRSLIQSFQATNGDATSIGIWALTNLGTLISIIAKVQNTISAIQSGNIANASDVQQALQAALSTLQNMQTQAQAAPPPAS